MSRNLLEAAYFGMIIFYVTLTLVAVFMELK